MKVLILLLALVLSGCSDGICHSEKHNEKDFKIVQEICNRNNGIKYSPWCSNVALNASCEEKQ